MRHPKVKAPSVLGRAKGYAVALNTYLPLFLDFRLGVNVYQLVKVGNDVGQPLLHSWRVQPQLFYEAVYLVDVQNRPYALFKGLPRDSLCLSHDALYRV